LFDRQVVAVEHNSTGIAALRAIGEHSGMHDRFLNHSSPWRQSIGQESAVKLKGEFRDRTEE
jgi:hypothetical protein